MFFENTKCEYVYCPINFSRNLISLLSAYQDMTNKLPTASNKSRSRWKMLELAALAAGLGGSATACLEMGDKIHSDEWVVMPNHFHGILIITGGGTACRAPTMKQFGKPVSCSVPTIIWLFKSASAKRMNKLPRTPGVKWWQRNY